MKNKKVCYTISQMSHNYHYAKRELEIEDLGISRFFIYPMLELLAIFLRLAKVDNSIMLNNWGISTNLYPTKIDEFNLRKIIDKCLKENKRESVIFRSVGADNDSETRKTHSRWLWRSSISFPAMVETEAILPLQISVFFKPQYPRLSRTATSSSTPLSPLIPSTS